MDRTPRRRPAAAETTDRGPHDARRDEPPVSTHESVNTHEERLNALAEELRGRGYTVTDNRYSLMLSVWLGERKTRVCVSPRGWIAEGRVFEDAPADEVADHVCAVLSGARIPRPGRWRL